MKIAHVVLKSISYPGGVENYVREIGPRLARMGHEVLVYTMRPYGTPPGDLGGMRLKAAWGLGGSASEKITTSFSATLDVCLREKPDLVHYHAFNHQVPFLPRWAGIPVLVQGQGIEWRRSRWGPLARAVLKVSEGLCVRSAHTLTVVSRVQQEYLREHYGRESVLIPNGVNPPMKRKPSGIRRLWGLKGKDYFLFAGRLVSEKGAHTLIEAFRATPPGLKLVLAGGDDQEPSYGRGLRRMADGRPDILFTGSLKGSLFQELMSNAYAFVLPSELEGLPTVLLEALSYGNCCLASDIPENQEALGGKGLTFRVSDPRDLAMKLKALAKNKALVAKHRAKAALGMQEAYGWDGIARRLHRLYLSMGRPS